MLALRDSRKGGSDHLSEWWWRSVAGLRHLPQTESATGALSVAVLPTGSGFVIPAGGDTCTGVALGPKKSCTIAVTYAPAAEGATDTARLAVTAKKAVATTSLSLTGTSPQGLSAGCADLAANGYRDSAPPPETMAPGDVIVLTPLSEPGVMRLAWSHGFFGGIASAIAPDSVRFYVEEGDVYHLSPLVAAGEAIDSWIWSCTAGS
jgi:hypothetical protein